MSRSLKAAAAAVAVALARSRLHLDPEAATTSGSASGSAVVKESTLRVWAGSMTPITIDFNPFHVDTALYGTYGPIYEPLFFFNQLSSDAPKPMLGDSYTYSADGKTITIKLKTGVKWNDGQPFTADDVVFTMGYGPNKTDKMLSAKATDASTVVLTYSTPSVHERVQLLGATMIVPKHIWSKIDSYMKETNPKPVGTGAYVVKTTRTPRTRSQRQPELPRPRPDHERPVPRHRLQPVRPGPAHHRPDRLDGHVRRQPRHRHLHRRHLTMNQQQDPTTIITCSDASKGCKGRPDRRRRPAGPQRGHRPQPARREGLGEPRRQGQSCVRPAAARRAVAVRPEPRREPPGRRRSEGRADPRGRRLHKDAKGFYGKGGKEINLDLFSPDGWTDYNDAAKLIAEEAGKAGIKVTARTVSEAEYWTPVTNGDFQMAITASPSRSSPIRSATTTSTSPASRRPRSAMPRLAARTTPATQRSCGRGRRGRGSHERRHDEEGRVRQDPGPDRRRPAVHPRRPQRVAGLLQLQVLHRLAHRRQPVRRPAAYLSVAPAIILLNLKPAQ